MILQNYGNWILHVVLQNYGNWCSLVTVFKPWKLLFKYYNTYFYTFFHPKVFLQNLNNIIKNLLPFGPWIASFARKLGAASSTMAELWARLSLAKQLNLLNVNIELDAEFIVHLLSNPTTVNIMLEPLINDFRTLIRSMPNCSITHIFREANRCVDKMAKMGAYLVTDFQILYELPPMVGNALAFDKVELFCTKLVV